MNQEWEGWIGTPYGIVKILNGKSEGSKKALKWLKRVLNLWEEKAKLIKRK